MNKLVEEEAVRVSELPDFCTSGFKDGFGREYNSKDCCWALKRFLQKRKKRILELLNVEESRIITKKIDEWISLIDSLFIYEECLDDYTPKSSVERVIHIEAAQMAEFRDFIHLGASQTTSTSIVEIKQKVRTSFELVFPEWVYYGFTTVGTRHSEAAEALRGWLIGLVQSESSDDYDQHRIQRVISAVEFVLRERFGFEDLSRADASQKVFDKLRAFSNGKEGSKKEYIFLNSFFE